MRFSDYLTIPEADPSDRPLPQPAAYTSVSGLGDENIDYITLLAQKGAVNDESASNDETAADLIGRWVPIAIRYGMISEAMAILRQADDITLREIELRGELAKKTIELVKKVRAERESSFPWGKALLLTGLAGLIGYGVYRKKKYGKMFGYTMQEHAVSANRDLNATVKIYEKFGHALRDGLCHQAHDRMLDMFAIAERFTANVVASGDYMDQGVTDTIRETLHQAKDDFNEYCKLEHKKGGPPPADPFLRRRYPRSA